jgi:magnesium-transporting ATPase (P-type)
MASAGDEIGPEEIWQEPVSRLLKRLATNPSDLDTAEAQSRFAVHGYNTAATVTRSPLWLQFLVRFRNPLVLILLAASGLSAAGRCGSGGGTMSRRLVRILSRVRNVASGNCARRGPK